MTWSSAYWTIMKPIYTTHNYTYEYTRCIKKLLQNSKIDISRKKKLNLLSLNSLLLLDKRFTNTDKL